MDYEYDDDLSIKSVERGEQVDIKSDPALMHNEFNKPRPSIIGTNKKAEKLKKISERKREQLNRDPMAIKSKISISHLYLSTLGWPNVPKVKKCLFSADFLVPHEKLYN